MHRVFRELPPLSLYIHVPWCLKKCPYCDFNSHENRDDELPQSDYVNALLNDLELELPDIWGRKLTSVFIGGGTPSLFSAESIDQLLSGVRSLTALPPQIEITMEANPGTFEQAKFADFHAAGINRLSIGCQSFNDKSLQALGRVHDGGEAQRAVDIARKAGFDNINLDLMYGLPQQSNSDAAKDIKTAITLEPEHISYYQLTLEPNTLFARHPPTLPPEDALWDLQQESLDTLSRHDYQRYEVSAFSRPGKRSTHNCNYWLYGDYVGIGAGAHGKISFANSGEIRRRWKVKHPKQYLDTAATAERIGGEHTVALEDTALEFMMNALRLTDGFALPLYALHTGTDLFQYQSIVDNAISDQLLEQDGLQLRTTDKGQNFLNDLLERFMPQSIEKTYPVIKLFNDPKRDY